MMWRKENSWPYRDSDPSVVHALANSYTDWAIPASWEKDSCINNKLNGMSVNKKNRYCQYSVNRFCSWSKWDEYFLCMSGSFRILHKLLHLLLRFHWDMEGTRKGGDLFSGISQPFCSRRTMKTFNQDNSSWAGLKIWYLLTASGSEPTHTF
jgi:hypothetical protein